MLISGPHLVRVLFRRGVVLASALVLLASVASFTVAGGVKGADPCDDWPFATISCERFQALEMRVEVASPDDAAKANITEAEAMAIAEREHGRELRRSKPGWSPSLAALSPSTT